MSFSRKVKIEMYKNVNVKSEPDLMASPTSQYQNIFQNVNYPNDDKTNLLNDLINSSTSVKDLIEYRAQRASVLFEMEKWQDCLDDIGFIEVHQQIRGSLLVLKWKSKFLHDTNKIRESMKDVADKQNMDNSHFMQLLDIIHPENIKEFIKRKKNVQRGCNKKRLGS